MSNKVVQLSTVHYINDVRILSKEAISLSKNDFEVHMIGLVYEKINLNIKSKNIFSSFKKINQFKDYKFINKYSIFIF